MLEAQQEDTDTKHCPFDEETDSVLDEQHKHFSLFNSDSLVKYGQVVGLFLH